MRKVREGRAGGADQAFVDKTYADWMAGKGASPCSVFNKNYKADCRLLHSTTSWFLSRVATIEAEIAPNQWNETTTRTQTIEESLDESLLGVLIPFEASSSQSASNVTDEILKEALCRDLEAFDEIYEVGVLPSHPEHLDHRSTILITGRSIALPSRTACAPCSMTGGQSLILKSFLIQCFSARPAWKALGS